MRYVTGIVTLSLSIIRIIIMNNAQILAAVASAIETRKEAALAITSDKQKAEKAWDTTRAAFTTSLYCTEGGEYAAEGIRIYCECFNLSVEDFCNRIAESNKKHERFCAQKALLKFAFLLQALAGATDENLTAYSRKYGKETLCDAHTHNIARIIIKKAEQAAAANGAFKAADLKNGLGYRELLKESNISTEDIEKALGELPDYNCSTVNTQMGQWNSIIQAFTDSKVKNKDGKLIEGRRAVQKEDTVFLDPRFVAMLQQINGSGYEFRRIDSRRM